jgi:hypothetical protein
MCLDLLRKLLFGSTKTERIARTETETTETRKPGYQQADDFEIDTNIDLADKRDVVSDEEDDQRSSHLRKSQPHSREKKPVHSTKLEVQEQPVGEQHTDDSRAADYFGTMEVKPVRIERKIPQARKMKEKREKTDVR